MKKDTDHKNIDLADLSEAQFEEFKKKIKLSSERELEILKLLSESWKLDVESRKLDSETRLNYKKTRWYEIALFLAIGAAIAAAFFKASF